MKLYPQKGGLATREDLLELGRLLLKLGYGSVRLGRGPVRKGQASTQYIEFGEGGGEHGEKPLA